MENVICYFACLTVNLKEVEKLASGGKIIHFENHCFKWSSGLGLSVISSFLYLYTGWTHSSYGLNTVYMLKTPKCTLPPISSDSNK